MSIKIKLLTINNLNIFINRIMNSKFTIKFNHFIITSIKVFNSNLLIYIITLNLFLVSPSILFQPQ